MECEMYILITCVILGSTYEIPEDLRDPSKIYFGSMNTFSNPVEILHEKIIKETDEYKEIERKKIERGTGQYWILISKASQVVKNIIEKYGKENDDIDFVTEKYYLESCGLNIEIRDVTDDIIEYMKESKK